MIVSLDPSSTRIGFAIRDGEKLECGILVPRPYTTDAMKRIRTLSDDLREFEELRQAELVLIENPPQGMTGKGNAILIQWAAYGAYRLVLSEMGVKPLREVCPSTWTKNREKDVWAYEIRRRFKLSEEGDPGSDAAAAVGILDWWLRIGRHRSDLVTA